MRVNLQMIEYSDRTPTRRELEKRYKMKFMDGKFPFGESDNCCSSDAYISDFISHRHLYHKMPMNEVWNELDEFMAEIFERHMKQNEDLR